MSFPGHTGTPGPGVPPGPGPQLGLLSPYAARVGGILLYVSFCHRLTSLPGTPRGSPAPQVTASRAPLSPCPPVPPRPCVCSLMHLPAPGAWVAPALGPWDRGRWRQSYNSRQECCRLDSAAVPDTAATPPGPSSGPWASAGAVGWQVPGGGPPVTPSPGGSGGPGAGARRPPPSCTPAHPRAGGALRDAGPGGNRPGPSAAAGSGLRGPRSPPGSRVS